MLPGKKYTPDDMLRIAWRGKWIILVPTVLGLVGAFLLARTLPDRYRSQARVLIVPQRVPTDFVRPTVTSRLDERLQSISQQIVSRTRLEGLIQEFNLYPEERKRLPLEDVVEQMRRDVGIEIPRTKRNEQPGFFDVRFDAPNPRIAMRVAERLASFFIDQNQLTRQGQASLTNEFLETQLQEAKAKLVDHEKKLEAYRRKYGAEMPTQQQPNLQMMQTTQVQLQARIDAATRDQERLVSVRRLLADAEASLSPEPTAGNDAPAKPGPAAQQLEAARAALQVLQTRLTPQHPDVVRAQKAIRELEQKAEAEALQLPLAPAVPTQTNTNPLVAQQRKRISDLRAEQELLEQRLASTQTEQERLQSALATIRSRIEAVPARETELTELMRDYETVKESYTSLLGKSQASSMAENLERRQISEQFRLIDAAAVPQRPISPNRFRMNLMGLAGGLALGLAILALLEYWDTTFATDADLVLSLAVPVLAVVPVMQTEGERRRMRRIRRMVWATAVFLVLSGGGLAAWKLRLIENLVR
jgi:polysaccharide chain length determinant protein (PEP-CTERM system associated)